MTIEQVIELFKSCERGEGQLVPFHLHEPIAQAIEQSWYTNDRYPSTFSGFLKALKDVEPIESQES